MMYGSIYGSLYVNMQTYDQRYIPVVLTMLEGETNISNRSKRKGHTGMYIAWEEICSSYVIRFE